MGDLDPSGGRVLIVDDEAINRELLRDLLHTRGHESYEAQSGQQALNLVNETPPDVILLDVMMPDVDGFEVCRRLKAQPSTAPIPIILVTALTDRQARLRGIKAGANDFLTKPIDLADTALRVQNAVNQKKLFDLSNSRLIKLRELEQSRQSLINMIVHDLRTPLSAMMGYVQLVTQNTESGLSDMERKHLMRAVGGGSQMMEMLNSLLDVAKMESGTMVLASKPESVKEILRDAAGILKALLSENVTLECSCSTESKVYGDRNLLQRILVNLGENALKHVSVKGGCVRLTVEESEDRITFMVRDDGRGIPPEALGRIFDKFGQVDSNQKNSYGLGLTFCRMAVEAHGGEIEVESELGKGSCFHFSIPKFKLGTG